ncbi:hypothetical protein [Kutzneria kofuensis]|uniref:Putative membrane protein n=1 Tax=Kutzneria kofuensis TaxID=103725 RepID=A0A7W9KBB6_9PSEU|nr:hypothetical protein [Kutzneria kofuensis]MBB5889391.1 putative membrane protein [Kutzneria kofuensis]
MGWRTLGVMAATLLAVTATATPALADAPHWQVSALPLPPGLEDVTGYVMAADGHGGYAGLLFADKGHDLVTWKDGKVTDHGLLPESHFGYVYGESRDDTVLVGVSTETSETHLYTVDATGYHAVSTGRYTDVRSAAIGPRGDMAVEAVDPAEPQSTVALYWSPFGQAGPRPLPGALPNSTPTAIDDDGTVLLADGTGPYLVRNGATRRLTVPSEYERPWANNIRHGVVVGGAVPTALPGPQAMVWTAPGYVATPLDHGAVACDVNASGLIAGAEFEPRVPEGPAAVWQGTTFLTELPLLDGTTKASARFIDDDGTIAGWSSAGSVGDGGRPVVWGLVSTA